MLFFSIGDVVSNNVCAGGAENPAENLDESAQFLLRIALFRSQQQQLT